MSVFLETKRLFLKTSESSELQEWILLCKDPVIMKYIDNVKTKEEIENLFFDLAVPYHKKHGLGFCSVIEKETGYFVGQAGLFHLGYDDSQADIEVAYRFLEEFWGKGYATEVTNALIKFCFSNLSVKKLVGFAWSGNAASSRVLQKAGMYFVEKKLGDRNQELLRYEIDRDTFIKKQSEIKNMEPKLEAAPLIYLYRQGEDYFFRGISLKCLHLGDGANAYMTGGAELNYIYITRNTNALDKILNQGRQFFDQDLSFEVIIPQELCTPQMAGVLNAMGYYQKSKSVSMAVDLDRFLINKTANFDTETIIKANDDQLNDWMMPLVGAFESTFEICSIYATIHESALKKNVNLRHFSLYKQETPIASITLSLNNGIARIDDVGTLPEFQRKGYATHLMRYVLSEAKRLGARHCFLEASDSGLGVYQKLGFEPLFKNNIYSRKA